MSRRWPGFVLVVLVALLALVAWFPAAWAWRMVRDRVPQLDLATVQGSVWNGRAEQVVYAGLPLGEVDWRLSRGALLGRIGLRLHVHGPLLEGRGQFRRESAGRLIGSAIHAEVHVDRIPISVGSPGLKPGGELTIRTPRVVIEDRWPRAWTGSADWRDATLADSMGPVALGTLHAVVHDRSGTALVARFSDTGGPLALSGTAEASLLGWRMDLQLAPRTDSPRLRRMLAHFGSPGAQGVVHLQRHGGMVLGGTP